MLQAGAQVYFYKPPASRRQHRRLQDAVSWAGPAVIVAMEKGEGQQSPSSAWLRYQGQLRRSPVECIRLATAEEVQGHDYVAKTLRAFADDLKEGQPGLVIDEPEESEDEPARREPEGMAPEADSDDSGISPVQTHQVVSLAYLWMPPISSIFILYF
jgi:hypothetical protein